MSRTMTVTDDVTGATISQTKIQDNANFVMLFRNSLPAVREVIMERPTAGRLLFFLAEHMSTSNALMTSQATISQILGISLSSVARDIKYLKEKNIIDTVFVGHAPAIVVNAQLAWCSHANGRKYAQFKADILISQTEQTKPRAKSHKILTVPAKKQEAGQQLIPGIE